MISVTERTVKITLMMGTAILVLLFGEMGELKLGWN